jgi:hypothetical protein
MSELLKIAHSLIWAAALIVVAYLVAPLFHHTQPAIPPPQATTAAQVEGLVKAAQALANIHGQASLLQQPAVTVIHDALPATRGMSDAEIALILENLKPHYIPVASAKTTVVPPSPAPIPTPAIGYTKGQAAFLYQTSYSADVAALKNTTIATSVTLDQKVAPLGRLSSVIVGNGDAGLGFDVLRRGQLNATLSAVENKSKIHPVIGLDYCLKGTSVCAGPAYEIGRGAAVGINVHF